MYINSSVTSLQQLCFPALFSTDYSTPYPIWGGCDRCATHRVWVCWCVGVLVCLPAPWWPPAPPARSRDAHRLFLCSVYTHVWFVWGLLSVSKTDRGLYQLWSRRVCVVKDIDCSTHAPRSWQLDHHHLLLSSSSQASKQPNLQTVHCAQQQNAFVSTAGCTDRSRLWQQQQQQNATPALAPASAILDSSCNQQQRAAAGCGAVTDCDEMHPCAAAAMQRSRNAAVTRG